jgi:hypothetical protein
MLPGWWSGEDTAGAARPYAVIERGDPAWDVSVVALVGRTSARHRQHVGASAWLIAPQVEQMASRMLMRIGVGRSGPKLSVERAIRAASRA